jgi:prepilin-type N-terminal cleavage/methylation domain-containing protein
MEINTAKCRYGSREYGFTLVELMAVIAIVGSLLMLSYSNSQPLFELDREAQAKVFILEISSQQAIFWQQHKIYAKNLSELKMRVPENLHSFYRVELTTPVTVSDQAGYLAKAIPVIDNVTDKTLWINHLGEISSNWTF